MNSRLCFAASFIVILLFTNLTSYGQQSKANLTSAVYPGNGEFGYQKIDNSVSVSGFFYDKLNSPIQNQNVSVYVNDILVGQTKTDSNGCYYYNNWTNQKLDYEIKHWIGINPTLPVKIKVKADSTQTVETDNEGWIRLTSSPAGGPAKLPSKYNIVSDNGTQPSINLATGGTSDLRLGITSPSDTSNDLKLSLKSLPCGLQALISTGVGNKEYTIHFAASAQVVPGNYLIGIVGSDSSGQETPIGMISLAISPSKEIPAPLQQFKSGIPINQIQCKEGLIVVLKTSNGNPICVKPDTRQKLIERGWAKST